MWYVLQVPTRKEEKMRDQLLATIDESVLFDCFCPKYEASYKKGGVRSIVQKIMFPGYLFVETDYIEEINYCLKKIPEFSKILKTGDEFVPITKEEEEFIMGHTNKDKVFEMSVGYLDGDRVVIESGAFQGYEGTLKYVNRHNRFAIMEVEMFNQKIDVKFGLELIRKIDE